MKPVAPIESVLMRSGKSKDATGLLGPVTLVEPVETEERVNQVRHVRKEPLGFDRSTSSGRAGSTGAGRAGIKGSGLFARPYHDSR